MYLKKHEAQKQIKQNFTFDKLQHLKRKTISDKTMNDLMYVIIVI